MIEMGEVGEEGSWQICLDPQGQVKWGCEESRKRLTATVYWSSYFVAGTAPHRISLLTPCEIGQRLREVK